MHAALPAYLAAALQEIRDGIGDVLDARGAALTSAQARRLVREVTAVGNQLYGAQLHALRVLTGHPDTPPTRGQTSQSGPANQSVKTYLTAGLHLDPAHAGRDLAAARLLDPDTGDLPAVGAALAAGVIGPDAVAVATRTHRALGATIRDRVDDDGHRLIGNVDALLADLARRHTHPELSRAADQIIQHLTDPEPRGAHHRRYLHYTPLADGSLRGRFACGPGQGALLQAALAAGSTPRPGLGIDPDGTQIPIRDDRSHGQRQMDALADLIATALHTTGTTLQTHASPAPDPEPPNGHEDTDLGDTHLGDTHLGDTDPDDGLGADPDDGLGDDPDDGLADDHEADSLGHQNHEDDDDEDDEDDEGDDDEDVPPPHEGEAQVLREPGVLCGPYPRVEILLVATLDQLTTALTRATATATATTLLTAATAATAAGPEPPGAPWLQPPWQQRPDRDTGTGTGTGTRHRHLASVGRGGNTPPTSHRPRWRCSPAPGRYAGS